MDRASDAASLVVVGVGGLAVVLSYAVVFAGERSSYLDSRFWAGIPPSTAAVLVPLQVLAGVGFVVFTLHATGLVGRSPGTGVLSYLHGYATTVLYAVFMASSVAWPFTARTYLDARDAGEATTLQLLAVVGPLVLAATSALLFTAGAFEATMHPTAIVGALAFATVVVLVDGVGWNARLILDHRHLPAGSA